jgi:hypothetical protein
LNLARHGYETPFFEDGESILEYASDFGNQHRTTYV